MNRILWMPDPPAGGGSGAPPVEAPFDMNLISEELRREPSLSQIKTLPALAKGYVEAQKMIGMKRIAVPGKDAKPEEWGQVFDALGRPKTPDEYSKPTVKAAAGVNMAEPDVKKFMVKMHELGLTDRQAVGLLDHYTDNINTTFTQMDTKSKEGAAQAEAALRTEWGTKYDSNLEISKAAFRRFADGNDEALKEVEAGLGNSPGLLKLFNKIGVAMLEDGAPNQPGLPIGAAATAQAKITELRGDTEFQRKMNSRTDPGHAAAVDLWLSLHRQADPGKVSAEG